MGLEIGIIDYQRSKDKQVAFTVGLYVIKYATLRGILFPTSNTTLLIERFIDFRSSFKPTTNVMMALKIVTAINTSKTMNKNTCQNNLHRVVLRGWP